MRNRVRLLAASSASMALISVLCASPATAAVSGVKETVTVQNRFGYAIGTKSNPVAVGPEKSELYVAGDIPGSQSEVGINYIGTAGSGSFFFLHDDYCVGSCASYSETVITFTITNENDGPVDLRFDSQITPGHIAMLAGQSRMAGQFNFDVVQSFGDGNLNLYNASGGVNSDGIFLNTGNLEFNGLNSQQADDGSWKVLDWSATALSVPLFTLSGGQTTTLSYIATYQVLSAAECDDIFSCQGLQIVFGDPRNDGGVTNLSDRSSFAMNVVDEGVYPVIGRNYDPYGLTFNFVEQDAPLPEQPAGEGPIKYGALFDPRAQAVPEPATWAMMIGGFGMLGSAARRRRATAAIA